VWTRRPTVAFKKSLDFFFKPDNHRAATAALILTTLAYLALELTRCMFNVGFDRHLLPLVPFVGIPILLALQNAGMTRMPILSWLTLFLFAIYGIAITQELNSLARARVIAIARLKESGIDDNQIDAGFEHNYWTQAIISGHINDARLPLGVYDPTKGPTPDLIFLYRLERVPMPDTEPSPFGQVDYFSLLPPFHRTVLIDKYKTPTPAPVRQILPKILVEQYKSK
jgi:hypothetical protein